MAKPVRNVAAPLARNCIGVEASGHVDSGRFVESWQKPADRLTQAGRKNRLAQSFANSGIQLADFSDIETRDDHDRLEDLRSRRVQTFHESGATHLWQHDVEKNQRVSLLREQLQRALAVAGSINVKAFALDNRAKSLASGEVIFDNQRSGKH